MEKQLNTTCCIVGGGPAGMMLGLLLARAGIEVIVLEKHADFFRDFRGDTLHPSTMQIFAELGLLEELLTIPHEEYGHLMAVYNNIEFEIADFSHLNTPKPVLGIMPQLEFLNFIAKQAKCYKTFKLMLEADVQELIVEKDRVVGVIANTPERTLAIRANLVIGTDGRHSIVRKQAKLSVISTGVPIDVLWFRVSGKDGDPPQSLARFYDGKIVIMIQRGEYWQCGYVIAKNGFDKLKEQGLDAFRNELLAVSPFLENRVAELMDWNDIRLLSVVIDHLEKWYCDGLLCIGDAAHAMSPVGGVGINLAIQDAVATANILYKFLQEQKEMDSEILKLVQDRRAIPTKLIQTIQGLVHRQIASSRTNVASAKSGLPLPFRLLKAFPILRRLPAYLIGIGVRPEHIKSPDIMKIR